MPDPDLEVCELCHGVIDDAGECLCGLDADYDARDDEPDLPIGGII